jgi:hypothetical protein
LFEFYFLQKLGMKNIWRYSHQTISRELLNNTFKWKNCPCCEDQGLFSSDRESYSHGVQFSRYLSIFVCETCGWWLVCRETVEDLSCGESWETPWQKVWATGAALEIFSDFPDRKSLIDLQSEIQDHLNGSGKSFSWGIFEDTTTAILRSMGYIARATAKSKDGGIDVILDHSKYGQIYTQVKHSKNKVGVRVLRELIGTMVLRGSTQGLLVTSSRFTQGLTKEQIMAESKGFSIELIDGERFLASLNLSTRTRPPKLDEVRDIAKPDILLFERQIEI